MDVQGDLNHDIVGASIGDTGEKNPDRIRIFSQALVSGADPAKVNLQGNENDSPSRELARFTQETGDRYGQGFHGELIFRADRFLRGGDHLSFNDAGFPAIRFTEPVETFAHQHQTVRTENGVEYGDLAKYMDFDYLARVTRYNVSVLASLAIGPGRPANAAILSSDTPASLGEQGPGEMSTRSGLSARASAGVISLLRKTRCVTPNWPKYWTRLKVKESKLSMTSSTVRLSGDYLVD